MTVPAKLKEADIARALRAAKKIGAKRVVIGADGSIDIWLDGKPEGPIHIEDRPEKTLKVKFGQHGPIHIEDHPKKKLVF